MYNDILQPQQQFGGQDRTPVSQKVQPPAPILPAAPSPNPGAPKMAGTTRGRMLMWCVVAAGGLLVTLAAVAYGSYKSGHSTGYNKGQAAGKAAAQPPAIKVPANATIIAQCTPGEGTQYILPKDIPMGPIYNVWQNKVVGIEYMVPENQITSGKNSMDLLAMGQKYDHADIMYEPKGHAGLIESHYHILLSMIPYADEQKITCGTSDAGMHM